MKTTRKKSKTMNVYQQVAANHAKRSFDFFNKMGAGLPLLNVTRKQVDECWVIVKQQYNAVSQDFKTFPLYEQRLKESLTEGEILYEDEYALVWWGSLPEFNLERKVEVSRALVA